MGADQVDARTGLVRLVFGGMAVHVVRLAAELRLADSIGDRERTVDDLAAEHDMPADRLNRLLRALAAIGLCTEHEPERFSLTPTGALLRTDVPGSMHAFARMFTDPVMLGAWPRLESSLRTGRTAFDEVFGEAFFEHLGTDQELSDVFNASMSQGTRAVAATLPGCFDFGRFGHVADIGGGDGTLVAAVLAEHTHLAGTVYDSPEGTAGAHDTLRAAGVADRGAVATGDFFESVPTGADLYLLKSIVHDWDDDRAATILGHCRSALPVDGRVLIIEPVLPPVVPAESRAGIYLSDLNMMVNLGGKERTSAEFEHLCSQAALTVTDIVPLPAETGYAMIEAAPA